MSEEVAVDDVDQTVQLLPHQATCRNLQDELGEQLATETEGDNQDKKVKAITASGAGRPRPNPSNHPKANQRVLHPPTHTHWDSRTLRQELGG